MAENTPETAMGSLMRVPLQVVKQLKDEPVLLGGMGASALLAIIALAIPAEGRIYAWLIAGLMLVLCLARAVTGAVRRDTAPRSDVDIEWGANSQADTVRLEGQRTSRWRSKRGLKVKDFTVITGAAEPQKPAEPAEPAEPGKGPE